MLIQVLKNIKHIPYFNQKPNSGFLFAIFYWLHLFGSVFIEKRYILY